jgi:hypothetical protein
MKSERSYDPSAEASQDGGRAAFGHRRKRPPLGPGGAKTSRQVEDEGVD